MHCDRRADIYSTFFLINICNILSITVFYYLTSSSESLKQIENATLASIVVASFYANEGTSSLKSDTCTSNPKTLSSREILELGNPPRASNQPGAQPQTGGPLRNPNSGHTQLDLQYMISKTRL